MLKKLLLGLCMIIFPFSTHAKIYTIGAVEKNLDGKYVARPMFEIDRHENLIDACDERVEIYPNNLKDSADIRKAIRNYPSNIAGYYMCPFDKNITGSFSNIRQPLRNENISMVGAYPLDDYKSKNNYPACLMTFDKNDIRDTTLEIEKNSQEVDILAENIPEISDFLNRYNSNDYNIENNILTYSIRIGNKIYITFLDIVAEPNENINGKTEKKTFIIVNQSIKYAKIFEKNDILNTNLIAVTDINNNEMVFPCNSVYKKKLNPGFVAINRQFLIRSETKEKVIYTYILMSDREAEAYEYTYKKY